MSNKINPVDQGMLGKIGNKVGESGASKKVGALPGASNQSADAVKSTTDTVELTSGGKLLERLEKTLSTLPEVNAARVDQVKSQIANGEYEIDSAKIAEAMLRFDREVGGKS